MQFGQPYEKHERQSLYMKPNLTTCTPRSQVTEWITAETGVSISEAINGDTLLLAFYKAARHLSKVQFSLAQQVSVFPYV